MAGQATLQRRSIDYAGAAAATRRIGGKNTHPGAGSSNCTVTTVAPVTNRQRNRDADVLSNDRVEFGIGRGAILTHFTGFSVPQAESRERFVEGLEVIIKAWSTERSFTCRPIFPSG
jgi:hypothetical protein